MTSFIAPANTLTPQTQLTCSTTAAAFPSVTARSVFVQNLDASITVYLGDSSVTSAGGGKVFCMLTAGSGTWVDIRNTSLLGYYVSASGAPKLALTIVDDVAA